MKIDLPENQLTRNAQDFARQIWLAGLGAFARAQNEGGKVFDTLVGEGQMVDARSKKAAQEKAGQTKESIEATQDKAEALQGKTTGSWSKLEEVFQARVTRALGRLGVPTQNDVQQLFQQVEQLNQNLQALTQATESTEKVRKRRTTGVSESSTGIPLAGDSQEN